MEPDSSPVGAPGVEFRGVSIEVGLGRTRRTLLADVDATFGAGEVTCVVGASGSGKSTLLRTIAGVHRPSAGEVLVQGENVTGLDERRRAALRRTVITTVEQDYNLLETLTARENILVLLELAGQGDQRDRADHWLERLGLWAVREEYPATLSGGEQQRVAIARSLAAPHPVVLADEPTGALDEGNTRLVSDLLHEFAEVGKCCIVVTHDPAVARSADRVLTLREGELG